MIRAVLDANVVISACINAKGPPGLVLDKLLFERAFVSVQSEVPLMEITSVISRPILKKYITRTGPDAQTVLDGFRSVSELVIPAGIPPVSRDPKDDIYLATAVAGRADFIVTGDADLLILKAHRGVRIVTPKEFLDELTR